MPQRSTAAPQEPIVGEIANHLLYGLAEGVLRRVAQLPPSRGMAVEGAKRCRRATRRAGGCYKGR